MKKTGKTKAVFCAAALLVAVSGCGQEKEQAELTPTPVPTATPVPATSTPMPTPTKTPRRIGEKKQDARFIYLNNHTGLDLRGIYVKVSGAEEWGRNLIPAEASVEKQEQVQMYYMPASKEEESSYALKVVTDKAEGYELYEIELEDMETATLRMEEDGTLRLRYMSLSQKKEITLSAGDAGEWEDSTGQEDFSQDGGYDGYYEDDYVENPYEDNWDSGYEEPDYVPDENEDPGTGDGSSEPGLDVPDPGTGDGSSGEDSQGEDGNTDQGGSDDGGGDSSGGDDLIWDENGNWVEG